MREIRKRMLVLIILCTGIFQATYGQAEFIITDARRNNEDITEWALNNGNKIVFYIPEEFPDEVYMANYLTVAETQSWGRTYDMSKEHYVETDTSYETDVYTFK